jgi:putative MATE family efflux protein
MGDLSAEKRSLMPMQNSLTTEPIPELVRRIAIPASIGFFFNTMYNVVDTYFAGLISTQALASLSLSLPVFFIIIAMGTGVSTGATALIANALGAGKREEARLYAAQAISFGILTSLALTVLGLLISPFLFRVLGATGEYLSTVLDYMNTLFLGTVFFMVLYMLNAVLNGQGETRPFRNFLIVGFFLNIALDPWFIYGGLGVPAMGVVGIALATLAAQGVGCVYLARKVLQSGLVSRHELASLWPKLEPFKEIARQGLPASVNMLTVAMGIFVITYFVSRFGKEAVAAYGSAMRIEQIALVPTIGLNVATLTLVAQNNGARLFHRVREVLRTTLLYGAIVIAPGAAAILAWAKQLMAFFTADGAVLSVGATYLMIDALALYAYVILFVNVAALQGMKRPMFSLWIGLYRQIVAPFIVFWFLTEMLEVGLLGIWWGVLAITWSAAGYSFFYTRRILRKVSYPGNVSS